LLRPLLLPKVDEQEAAMNLADDVANLLSDRKNESFLHAVFRRDKGSWASLSELCHEARIEPPSVAARTHVSVAWLDDPDEAPGYALVLFVATAELQSTIATYNRAWLLRGARAGMLR
jgi:hypothetical protein